MSFIQSPIDFELINKYDENGNLVVHTTSDGTRKEYRYDKKSNLIYYNSVKDNTEEIKEYDDKNRLIKSVNSDGTVTTKSYYVDDQNRISEILTKVTDVFNNEHMITQKYEYFIDGSYKITYFNDMNEEKIEVYDRFNRITLEDSRKFTRIFIYDRFGNKIKNINSIGNEENWEYNQNNQIVSHYVKRNDVVTYKVNYIYDTKGNMIQESNINGTTIDYKYNENNQKILMQTSSNYYEKYFYDEKGRKCKTETPILIKEWTYDDSNRLVKFVKRRKEKND